MYIRMCIHVNVYVIFYGVYQASNGPAPLPCSLGGVYITTR